ncbi:hypothetical protein FQN54_000691 [Arachnomyces sp. PD_36]|nr:hypothetical protein FQN54_000691 [Arachnomyces sp. PD_36]
MAARLNLTLEDFDPEEAARTHTVTQPLGPNESTAYNYVGTTAYSNSRVFLILRDFLQPRSSKSLDETVKSILNLLPENAPESDEVWCVGQVILELADQIPYYHPSQVKLARVMEQLCRSKKTTEANHKGMYFCFRSFHESLIMDGYNGPNPDDLAAWPNRNAFIAHFEECHIWRTSPHWAIRAMRFAFEFDSKKEDEWFEDLQSQHVLAAAQYILWNGQNLLKQVMYFSNEEALSGAQEFKTGPLYDGRKRHGFYSLDRWRFWKWGFQASAEDSTLNDEARGVAKKAADLMVSLEQNMLFHGDASVLSLLYS